MVMMNLGMHLLLNIRIHMAKILLGSPKYFILEKSLLDVLEIDCFRFRLYLDLNIIEADCWLSGGDI